MVKKYLTISLLLATVIGSGFLLIVKPEVNKTENGLFGGYYTPPTDGIEFGFALYNSTVKADTQEEWVESGATVGRMQCTNWRSNQTDNGDGTYTYNWNAVAGCTDLDDLVNNGDITVYHRIDTQGSGAPTVTGMTNFYFNTLQDPVPYVDFVKTLANRYKAYTHYYTFNNEADYNFVKDATTKQWNATARNFVASFIMTSKAIKQADPSANVCFNMTHADFNPNPDFNPYKGIDAMLELGAGNYIDCIDLHFYGSHDSVDGVWKFRSIAESFIWSDYADDIKSRLTNYGIEDVDLWIGESGIGTYSTSSSSYEASVTAQSLEIVKQNLEFTSQGYTKIFNILLFDLISGTCGGETDWYCGGIMDGAEVKKSSFNVYKKNTGVLKGMSFVSTSTPGTILQYRYSSSTADTYAGYSNVDGDTTWDVTLDRNYTSGKIIDAIALTESDIPSTSLQSGDTISETVSTTTIKYLYLIK